MYEARNIVKDNFYVDIWKINSKGIYLGFPGQTTARALVCRAVPPFRSKRFDLPLFEGVNMVQGPRIVSLC